MTAIPYHLKPKATKLPEGHDVTLDAPGAVDAAARSVPVSQWPAVDLSRGGSAAPDAPIAPPPVPPLVRSVPASTYPIGATAMSPNRPLVLAIPEPDLDPDIAFWPVTPVQRWPFAGHPIDGIWPLGWCGIDNTGTLYICTAGGSPGTWSAIGGPGTDTGWINVTTFVNGWIAGGVQPRYRKINGIVYLEGTLNSASATNVLAFTLPAGFQPNETVQQITGAVDGSNAFVASQIFVQGNGTGRVLIGTYASGGNTAPAGGADIQISFPADQ